MTEMRRLIIGSTAMAAHGVGNRAPKDLDLFTDGPGEGGDTLWEPEFAQWLPDGTDRTATIDELYTIKLSHAYWVLPNNSWNKHMNDLVTLQDAGGRVDQHVHDLLRNAWQRRNGSKRVNLNQGAFRFFTDNVERTYTHDSVHHTIAYGNQPMFTTLLKPGATVDLDMKKVWALPVDDQIRLFREEMYAIALERVIIPSEYTASPRAAYCWAVRRIITNLTKGRSAQFVAEHYKTFRAPDIDYMRRHLSNLDKLIPLEMAA